MDLRGELNVEKVLIISTFLLFTLFIPLHFYLAFTSAGGGQTSTSGGSSSGGSSGTSDYTPVRGPIYHNATPAEFTTTIIIVMIGWYFVGKMTKNPELPILSFSTGIKNENKGVRPEDDDFWADSDLKTRIETCFIEIQKAWSEQVPEKASTYMSEGLLSEHKRLIQEMKKNNERNIVS